MPLPFIIWGASVALAAIGIAGVKNQIDEAQQIRENEKQQRNNIKKEMSELEELLKFEHE
jgi:hypothetical protein